MDDIIAIGEYSIFYCCGVYSIDWRWLVSIGDVLSLIEVSPDGASNVLLIIYCCFFIGVRNLVHVVHDDDC